MTDLNMKFIESISKHSVVADHIVRNQIFNLLVDEVVQMSIDYKRQKLRRLLVPAGEWISEVCPCLKRNHLATLIYCSTVMSKR